jgi:hypothetical protein
VLPVGCGWCCCQGLPFGGVKFSGFGRFGGVEGLRALCTPKVSLTGSEPGIFGFSFFLDERERPRQWHSKGASSTRAQAAGPTPCHHPGCPVPGPMSKGVEPSHPSGVLHSRARTWNNNLHRSTMTMAFHNLDALDTACADCL